MAAAGACVSTARFFPLGCCCATPTTAPFSSSLSSRKPKRYRSSSSLARRFTVSASEQAPKLTTIRMTTTSFPENGRLGMKETVAEAEDNREAEAARDAIGETTAAAAAAASLTEENGEEKLNPYRLALERPEMISEFGKSLKDYFGESVDLITRSYGGGGPPRWFSPLESGSRSDNSPLLLFLPGIDGVGLGLIRQHHNLGKIFEIWCLHIPVKDRTSFTGLVKLIEGTVRSESNLSPNRPIYLVGESLGACLALAVAARNPNIDLMLILSNPGTSFKKSQLQTLIPLLELIPNQYQLVIPYMLNLMKGDSLRIAMDNALKGLPFQQTVGRLAEDVVAIPSYLSVLTDILPRETFLWKLQMLQSASAYVNSRLHTIRAQALILTSGKDQLLPSQEEGERLHDMLPKSESRTFEDKGHFLFLEDNVDLVSTIKGAGFYCHGKLHDYVSDYIPPTASEFKKEYESNRWLLLAASPVMLSTCEDGKVVKGLAGVPSEGPVLFVGYHMLLGLELAPMVLQFLLEKNVSLRGLAHPAMFSKLKGGIMPDTSRFDAFRLMGAVPVSGTHFFKLLSSKSHVLLYPGGVREACHRKGEQYQLFWPERSEFVRMAARFGAKIVPFGVVGEDDFAEVVFDYDDQLKTPFLGDYIKTIREETKNIRIQLEGEVGNQDMHLPGIMPKFPGRLYYYFGRPIQTEGRKNELRDREKAHELYLQVKSEVEKCLAFLEEKREEDPYRNILARLTYQATHGVTSKIPTFEL